MSKNNQQEPESASNKFPIWIFYVFIPIILILLGVGIWWYTQEEEDAYLGVKNYLKENTYVQNSKELALYQHADFNVIIPIININKLQKQLDSLNQQINQFNEHKQSINEKAKERIKPYFLELEQMKEALRPFKNLYQNEVIVDAQQGRNATSRAFKKLLAINEKFHTQLTQYQLLIEQTAILSNTSDQILDEAYYALKNLEEAQVDLLNTSAQLKKQLFLFEYQYNQDRYTSPNNTPVSFYEKALDRSYILTQDALYNDAILRDERNSFVYLLGKQQHVTKQSIAMLEELRVDLPLDDELIHSETVKNRIIANITTLKKFSPQHQDLSFNVKNIKAMDAHKMLHFSSPKLVEKDGVQMWTLRGEAKELGKTSIQFDITGSIFNPKEEEHPIFSIKIIEKMINITEH